MFGFVNIYKPEGMTSFDVVAKVRKIACTRSVGHAGTLDPFATGVLPVAIGKATKLIEYLHDDKEYIATVQFGANTNTYDIEGEITQKFEKHINVNDVETALKNFEGEIEQIPPIYSAIKIKGKKLYEYARNGVQIEVKPRSVNIYEIKLIEFNDEKQIARIKVSCSKGTYIRSIAYDLGKILECGGYLIALERTKAGNFTAENTIKLEDLTAENIESNIINPIDIFPETKYILNEKEKERVNNGLWFIPSNIDNIRSNKSPVVFLIYGGKMYGVGMVDKDRIIIKKVFGV